MATTQIGYFKETFKPVIHKSRAGVKYTHYESVLKGKPNEGENRATRRRKEALERSAKYQRFMKLKTREAVKKHRKEQEESRNRKTLTAESFLSKLIKK